MLSASSTSPYKFQVSCFSKADLSPRLPVDTTERSFPESGGREPRSPPPQKKAPPDPYLRLLPPLRSCEPKRGWVRAHCTHRGVEAQRVGRHESGSPIGQDEREAANERAVDELAHVDALLVQLRRCNARDDAMRHTPTTKLCLRKYLVLSGCLVSCSLQNSQFEF